MLLHCDSLECKNSTDLIKKMYEKIAMEKSTKKKLYKK